jgi:hypothetical protein
MAIIIILQAIGIINDHLVQFAFIWYIFPVLVSRTKKNLATLHRVARWFVFKPNIPIWVDFGGSCYGKSWYTYFMTIWSILRPLEMFYGLLVYFVVIWYIFPVLVFWTKKNLATLCDGGSGQKY